MSSTDEYGRRTWDAAQYEKKRPAEGEEAEDGDQDDGKKGIGSVDQKVEGPKAKEHLKPRDERIDLEKGLGKTVVISKAAPSSQAGGFYCDVCDCVVKDSINYLDHINGKKHQKNLGMTMKVKRSTLDDVNERFEKLEKEKNEEKKVYDVQERMAELKEEEQKVKEYRKEKRKEKKKRKHGTDDGDDDNQDMMAQMMGFSGFTSKKK